MIFICSWATFLSSFSFVFANLSFKWPSICFADFPLAKTRKTKPNLLSYSLFLARSASRVSASAPATPLCSSADCFSLVLSPIRGWAAQASSKSRSSRFRNADSDVLAISAKLANGRFFMTSAAHFLLAQALAKLVCSVCSSAWLIFPRPIRRSRLLAVRPHARRRLMPPSGKILSRKCVMLPRFESSLSKR